MSYVKVLAAVAAVGLGAGLLTSCSSGDSADSESLVVYSGRSESLVEPVIEEFEAQTGIAVEVRYGDTSGMAAQLIEEGDRTPAQVFLAQDGGALGALADEGLLAPLDGEVLARVSDTYRDADGQWVGVTGRARVMVYDPEQVPEADLPSSVYELTEPQWRGRVGIAPGNASFQSFVTAMRVMAGDEATRQWLQDMVDNDVQTYDNNIAILAAVNAGELPLGLINHYYWFGEVAEVGAENVPSRLAYTDPADPGSLVNISGAAILSGAADDPDAAAFVDFLLGDWAQTYFTQTNAEFPMIAGIETNADLPDLGEIGTPGVALGDLADLPGTVAMIQDVGLL